MKTLILENWHWFFWTLIVLVCFVILRAMSPRKKVEYGAADTMFKSRTLKLWQALCVASDGEWLVLPDVALSRIMRVIEPSQKSDDDPFKGETIDFVLFDPRTGRPVLAVNIDAESSDEEEQGLDSDESILIAEPPLRKWLDWIELPLLMVERQRKYDVEELRLTLEEILVDTPKPRRRRRSA